MLGRPLGPFEAAAGFEGFGWLPVAAWNCRRPPAALSTRGGQDPSCGGEQLVPTLYLAAASGPLIGHLQTGLYMGARRLQHRVQPPTECLDRSSIHIIGEFAFRGRPAGPTGACWVVNAPKWELDLEPEPEPEPEPEQEQELERPIWILSSFST